MIQINKIMINIMHLKIFVLSISISVMVCTNRIHAQNLSSSSLFALANDDGRAFVYMLQPPPLSHGFHVYRMIDGQGEWDRLTERPFMPVQNGFQLKQQLDSSYRFIEQRMGDLDPQSVFLTLRSGTSQNLLTILALPELAQVLGFLYIDQHAPVGQEVSYRIEIVNDIGRTTGLTFESTQLLEPIQPPPVSSLEIKNEGRQIIMNWEYPEYGTVGTEYVLLFRPRYRIAGESRVREAVSGFILRTTDSNRFEYRFNVPILNKEYDFWVEARDYTGQASLQNNILRINVLDNVQPPALTDVQIRNTRKGFAEISWPVTRSIDAAGYHIYRAKAEDDSFTKLTTQALTLLNTTYVDSTVAPGVQYRYGVTVVGNNNLESKKSNIAHVYMPDTRRPPPVTGIDVRYNEENHTIHLTWDSMTEYASLRSYRIIRRQVNPQTGGGFSQVNDNVWLENNISDHGITGMGFQEGATYQYGVFAIHQNDNMGDTLFVSIQVPVLSLPSPPSGIQARMESDSNVAITWGASNEPRVTSYNLYRKDDYPDQESRLLYSGNRNNRFYLDENLALNRSYIYSVTAIDSVGNESEPLVADTLLTVRAAPPVAVHNLQAVFTNEGVQLAWQSRDEAEQLSGFRVYRAESANGEYVFVNQIAPDKFNFFDNEGINGHWYKVYPVDIVGRNARQSRAVQAVKKI